MSQGTKGKKFMWLMKWGALMGGLAITYATGHLIMLAMTATAAYIGWQVMKGAPWDRAAVMPAGLWGGSYGVNNVLEGQAGGPIDAILSVVIGAILAIVLVWVVKFGLGKLFR
jgi:hypothetical protein